MEHCSQISLIIICRNYITLKLMSSMLHELLEAGETAQNQCSW